jgi:hypothetical protein
MYGPESQSQGLLAYEDKIQGGTKYRSTKAERRAVVAGSGQGCHLQRSMDQWEG